MTRFIDYFFMCGLPDNRDPRLYKIHEEESAAVQYKGLVSSILCHFPKQVTDNPWNSAEIWKLCTPYGLSVFLGKTSPIIRPHFHSFLITREDGFKCYGHVLVFFEHCTNCQLNNKIAGVFVKDTIEKNNSMVFTENTDLMQFSTMMEDDNIYIQKCIGFITQLPLINSCEKILKTLFDIFTKTTPQSNGNSLSIESYIYNLLYEAPLLKPGTSFKLSWMGHEDPTIIQQPSLYELPLLDVYLMQVMGLLGGPKNLISLLTSFLLEHQILLVSEDSQRLSLVGEGMTSLLFPFQWQHTQVSILPYELAVHFLDAPVPYVIGVLVLPGQKELVRQALEADQCFVDLDDALIETPEEQPCFPNQKEIVSQLISYLEDYQTEMKILARQSIKLTEPAAVFSPSPDDVTKNFSSLRNNETVNRVAEIAKKAGVINSLDDIEKLQCEDAEGVASKLQVSGRVLCELKFNVCLRETIAAAFVAIFQSYDKFVIMPCLDEHGLWTFSTETQDNFDKTSFLSDQPEAFLPFLLPFLDTQMFATLIDNSVICHQQAGNLQQDNADGKDPNLRLFDYRIEQKMKDSSMEVATPTTPDLPFFPQLLRGVSVNSANFATGLLEAWIKKAEQLTEKRLTRIDVSSGFPKAMESDVVIENYPGTFPIIRAKLLDSDLFEKSKKHQLSRRGETNRSAFKRGTSFRDSKWRKVEEARSSILRQPSVSEYSPEVIAQTNWWFVRKLLKDVKQKTKKVLVGKMGREAVELGHAELSDSLSDLEESTWIASFCDLLEKVWSHGVFTNYKKGKSALWSHLLQFQVEEEEKMRKKSMLNHLSESTPSLLKSDDDFSFSSATFDSSSYNSLPRSFPGKQKDSSRSLSEIRLGSPENKLLSSSSSSNVNSIPHLTFTLLSSIERIQSMREIQTEVGRSRAWIRLVLEQQQLHLCLTQLLSDHLLLNRMYKKYSFLQCDEQREQFLYHVLTLKAADFTCFTTSFKRSIFEYKVWIIPCRNLGHLSQTTANVYVSICGEIDQTSKLQVPKNCLEFSFKHRNLGILTTLTIGHDNSGILPKWLLDYVVVQNQVTGQTHSFPCRRWLGRNVDDGSIERLLIPEFVPRDADITKVSARLSQQKMKNSYTFKVETLQEMVGHAVNCLVKYYHKSERERRLDFTTPPAAFTKLLYNLTVALESVFTHGLKTTGIFKRRRLFALDVFAACLDHLRDSIHPPLASHDSLSDDEYDPGHIAAGGDWFLGNRSMSEGAVHYDRIPSYRSDLGNTNQNGSCVAKERAAFARMCQLYQQITQRSSGLGKDDIFQLLILIGIHEQSLSVWLPKISLVARKANHLYERHAFLCDGDAVCFMSQVLTLLVENAVPLDCSLLRGFHDLLQC